MVSFHCVSPDIIYQNTNFPSYSFLLHGGVHQSWRTSKSTSIPIGKKSSEKAVRWGTLAWYSSPLKKNPSVELLLHWELIRNGDSGQDYCILWKFSVGKRKQIKKKYYCDSETRRLFICPNLPFATLFNLVILSLNAVCHVFLSCYFFKQTIFYSKKTVTNSGSATPNHL
jgi:hypothetical protein